MKAFRRFLIRLAGAVSPRRHEEHEERLRDEVEEHLALRTDDNIRRGLSPTEARRKAVLEFGPVEAVKERYREERRLPLLEHVRQDVRYTLRQLLKSPLFTLTATLSLAVGIGANTAVFTLVDRLLLKSLPVTDPEALVFVVDQRISQAASPRFSYPFYAALRESAALSGMVARFSLGLNGNVNGQAVRVRAELVSGNFFSVLGADTQIGRPLVAEDDRTPGSHWVAVISDRFWRRSFSSDPSVVGRGIQINGHTFTIVGVAQRAFNGIDVGNATEVWLPLIMQREVGRDLVTNADTNWLEIIGRLRPGVDPQRAAAELTQYVTRTPAAQLGRGASSENRRIALLPAGKGSSSVRREVGPALKVLGALTGLALVLACINVASLLAVRSVSRQKEIAVRLALGASHPRLARQFLTETLVLAAIGGGAGLVAAPWAAGWLAAAQPGGLGIDAALDGRVFLFGLGVSAFAGVLVGQAPILAAKKVSIAQAFANVAMIGIRRRLTLHDLIVTSQIGVSLAMLISAALLVQSLRGLSTVDLGFPADDLLLVTLDPKAAGYDRPRLVAFWRDTLDRVRNIHGVQSVSLAGTVPLAPGRQRQPFFDPTVGEFVEIDTNFVAPEYFRTLGVPLIGGREFNDQDVRGSRQVVIVNERLARMLSPGQDPIGTEVRMAGNREEFRRKAPLDPAKDPQPQIVGVVKDVKYRDLRADAGPVMYRPLFQVGTLDAMTLHVRAAVDATALAATIRREMQALDANVPVFDVRTLDDQLNASFAHIRQAALLTGGFGVLALLLSGIGVYGVTALAVSRRTHEIGIRLALGATGRDIALVIGRRGLALVVTGLALGLVGSFGFTQIAEALLFGVTAGDAVTFAAMSALLAAVSLAAISIAARAAIRLDTLNAIRRE